MFSILISKGYLDQSDLMKCSVISQDWGILVAKSWRFLVKAQGSTVYWEPLEFISDAACSCDREDNLYSRNSYSDEIGDFMKKLQHDKNKWVHFTGKDVVISCERPYSEALGLHFCECDMLYKHQLWRLIRKFGKYMCRIRVEEHHCDVVNHGSNCLTDNWIFRAFKKELLPNLQYLSVSCVGDFEDEGHTRTLKLKVDKLTGNSFWSYQMETPPESDKILEAYSSKIKECKIASIADLCKIKLWPKAEFSNLREFQLGLPKASDSNNDKVDYQNRMELIFGNKGFPVSGFKLLENVQKLKLINLPIFPKEYFALACPSLKELTLEGKILLDFPVLTSARYLRDKRISGVKKLTMEVCGSMREIVAIAFLDFPTMTWLDLKTTKTNAEIMTSCKRNTALDASTRSDSTFMLFAKLTKQLYRCIEQGFMDKCWLWEAFPALQLVTFTTTEMGQEDEGKIEETTSFTRPKICAKAKQVVGKRPSIKRVHVWYSTRRRGGSR